MCFSIKSEFSWKVVAVIENGQTKKNLKFWSMQSWIDFKNSFGGNNLFKTTLDISTQF